MGLIAGVDGMEDGITLSCWDLNPGSSSPWPSHDTYYAILTPVYQSCTLQKHTVFHSVVDSQEFDEKTLGPIVWTAYLVFIA